MSTSTQVSPAPTSGLRNRACKRIACTTPTPDTEAGKPKNCCDENCLIEVARRECNNECSPISQPSDPVTTNNNNTFTQNEPQKQQTKPCTTHYQKTKARYGAMLENLGCICKVLLSLNIESCCVIPSHASTRGCVRSTISGHSKEDLENEKAVLMGKESCCGDSEMGGEDEKMKGSGCEDMVCCEVEKVEDGVSEESEGCEGEGCCDEEEEVGDELVKVDDCSKDSCCGTFRTVEREALSKDDDCSKLSCCGPAKGLPKTITESPMSNDCSKQSCCSSKTSAPKLKGTITKVKGILKKDCCSNGAVTEAIAVKTDDCLKKSCCTKSASGSLPPAKIAEAEDCSKKGCCTGEVSLSSSSSMCIEDVPALSSCEEIKFAPATLLNARVNNIDIEKGLSKTEHLILSVQGMTCTGCEKKLYRSLQSLPTLSNVKTSLLLAQAEFDLSGSDAVGIVKTIEKMTGFTCTKMSQSGQELDLITSCPAQDFAGKEDLLYGVTNLTILTKNTIRVTYKPQVIGARDLLQDPFFRLTTLAPVEPPPIIASGRAHVLKTFYLTLLSALLTIPVLILAWAPLPSHPILYGAISLSLATLVQFFIAGPFYNSALKGLIFSRMIEMDLLIVLSTSTAYLYSIIAYAYLVGGIPLATGQFFETSTLLVTLIMVGRTMSAFARQKAVESISISSLQTPLALLSNPQTGQDQEIDARLLQYGDTFKVLPDTSIVTDGLILTGSTEIDESMITGESLPLPKVPGMKVIAGSLNHSGTLTVKLTHLPSENTIHTISSLVDEAKSSKPAIQELADRVASYFVPLILIITLIIFMVWVIVGKKVRNEKTSTAAINAMTYAISALIISCPCAIGLAVPMVVVIAGGVGAKYGIVFKGAQTVEVARKVGWVVFDKTGTLTEGKMGVIEELVFCEGERREDVRGLVRGVVEGSKHPVSLGVSEYLKTLDIQPTKLQSVVSVAGNGLEATHNKQIIRAGNPFWLRVENHPSIEAILEKGLTIFCVTIDRNLVAIYALHDSLRYEAISTITELKKRGIEISIVSGDHESAVHSIASQLDIPTSHIRARCSPADKQQYIKTLLSTPSKSGKKPTIIFIGDGTNDAPALAQATIGIHISSGTEIAKSAADVVLMSHSLKGVITLIDLSKAFWRRVMFNFGWSFVYNVFAILLAAGVFPRGVRIPPAYAGLGEIVSVLPVVVVGWGLRWVRI